MSEGLQVNKGTGSTAGTTINARQAVTASSGTTSSPRNRKRRSESRGVAADASMGGRKLDASAPTFTPQVGALQQSSSAASPQGVQARQNRSSSFQERNSKMPGPSRSGGSACSSSAGNGRQNVRRSGGDGGKGRGRGGRRNGGGSTAVETAPPEAAAGERNSSRGDGRKQRGGSEGTLRGGDAEGVSVEGNRALSQHEQASDGNGDAVRGNGRKGGRRKGSGAARNANHLLNFQFQPLPDQHQIAGEGEGGRSKRGNGGGSGARKNSGVWGGGSARGPMSKEQFLQANFHFLLHAPAMDKGKDEQEFSLGLQEAFFDPDVLVDWDTVDTVRLMRKVIRRPRVIPSSTIVSAASTMSGAEAAAGGVVEDETKTLIAIPMKSESDVSPEAWGSATKRASRAETGVRSLPSSAATEAGREQESTPVRTTDAANDDESGDRENADDDDWRCPICLAQPVAPRITKCGHGPFCLVCILRHLQGHVAARCPLCFDTMHRDRLRRAMCNEVVSFIPGGKVSLLLLQRPRESLVPDLASLGKDQPRLKGAEVSEEAGRAHSSSDIFIESRFGERTVVACPREGDSAERFSRLVRAKTGTLLDLATAEALALQRFRSASLSSGETEWIPYVTQAQDLVSVQVERFTRNSATAETITRFDSTSHNPATEPSRTECERVTSSKPATSSGWGDTDQRHQDNGKDQAVLTDDADEKSSTGDRVEMENEDKGRDAPEAPVVPGFGPFRFFQSSDGQKAFLHPLDMRQLLDDAELGIPLPDRLDAEVLEVETVKLTPELRRRLPFLSHLPIHCDVSFLEVDMTGLVSEGTAKKFMEGTQKRERTRRARTAQEERDRAKEQRAEANRAAKIAAMRAFTVDLQGPKPGDVDTIPPSPPASSTTHGDASASSHVDSTSHGQQASSSSEHEAHTSDTIRSNPSGSDGGGGGGRGEGGWSFARITAMNGHFPSLDGKGPTPAASRSNAAGAGGTTTGSTGPWGASSAVAGGGGAWGTPKRDSGGVARQELSGLRLGAAAGPDGDKDGATPNAAGKSSGKGKKSKGVSLFSNAGVRGGR